MSSSVTTAEQYLTRYGVTTYLILGDIGLLFNMLIFSRSAAHRQNSCSLYLLAMSFCSFIGLDSAVIPNIYALNHLNPLSYSLVFCKLQYFLRHGFSQLMRVFFILACADCYAACSHSPRIRSFSSHQYALRVIPIVSFCWLLIAIFPTILYSIQNNTCDASPGLANFVYSIYILIVLGVFPILSMTTFASLLLMNLKKMRLRIHSLSNTRNSTNLLRRRDRDLVRMLLVVLIIYICTTLPNTIVLIYKLIVQMRNMNITTDAFLLYFARFFLLYLNNSLPFWIFFLTSRTFRMEFKGLILKYWSFIRPMNTPRIQAQ